MDNDFNDIKKAFSQRLKQALLDATGKISPTKLANQFNLRYPKEAISTQAASQWLNGQTIPTKDKIKILAKWLNVSEFWLNYGSSANSSDIQTNFNNRRVSANSKFLKMEVSPLEQQVLLLFRELSASQSKLVYELIYELSKKSFGRNSQIDSENEDKNGNIKV